MAKSKYTPEKYLQMTLDRGDFLRTKVSKAISRFDLANLRKRRLLALLGMQGYLAGLPLSDLQAREASTKILRDCFHRHFEGDTLSSTKAFFVTFVDDLGITSDQQPIIRLAALRRKIDKAIRKMGLSAVVTIELQPLTNYPAGGLGRTLMLNAHAICWGNITREGIKKCVATLNDSRSWSNEFEAQPIKYRRLESVEEIGNLSCYLSKVPSDAKYRVPAPEGAKGYRFRPTQQGLRHSLALRVLEALSHYSIFDGTFGVGEGTRLRAEWKSQLKSWERDFRNDPIAPFSRIKLWNRIHRCGHSFYKCGVFPQ